MGINPSKSAHFIILPLTSSHIFAALKGAIAKDFPASS